MPVRFASSTMASCIAALSPPSSAKPEEMITAFLTPAAAHCSSAPSTARAGNDDDGEIDRLRRHRRDRRIAFQPVDLAVVGIDRIESCPEIRSCAASPSSRPGIFSDRARRRSARCIAARTGCRADAASRQSRWLRNVAVVNQSTSLSWLLRGVRAFRRAQTLIATSRNVTPPSSTHRRRRRSRLPSRGVETLRPTSTTSNVSPLMSHRWRPSRSGSRIGQLQFRLAVGRRRAARSRASGPNARPAPADPGSAFPRRSSACVTSLRIDRLPVRPGRRIGPAECRRCPGVVEFDEGGAAVARMQLHAVIGRVVDLVGDAHADVPRRACRARRDRRSRRSPCSRHGRRSCRESGPPRCRAGSAPPPPAGWCRPAAARFPGHICATLPSR